MRDWLLAVCICGAMVASIGCDGSGNDQWTITVEEIVEGEDIYVTSLRVVSDRASRLVITEAGNVRDGILLTENGRGQYEGDLIVCACRMGGEGMPETARVWYRLQSGGVRSLSGDVVELGMAQDMLDTVVVNTADGQHGWGDSAPFVTLGHRELELSLR